MKTTRLNSRVTYYALAALLFTLVPSSVYAHDVSAAGHALLHSAPWSAPRDPNDRFYRAAWNAGSIWELKPAEITKIEQGSTRYGVSVYNQAGYDAGKLDRFPCIYVFIRGDVPATLKVQQRGIDPTHNEIMPVQSTTVVTYSHALAQIPLYRVKGNRFC
jgi:hypothetical protein